MAHRPTGKVNSAGSSTGTAGATGTSRARTKPAVPPAPTEVMEDLKPVQLGKASDEDLMRRTQLGDKQRLRAALRAVQRLGPLLPLPDARQPGGRRVDRAGGLPPAFRFAPTYRYPQKFSTWLFTITRNLAINQSRRRKRSPIRNITELNLDGVDISGDPYQVATRATDDLEKQEEITRVLKALETLPTDQKEVIVLGVFQDLSYAEMEEITGTKAVTLRSRMFHGLKRLARTIGGGEEGEVASGS